MKRIFELTKKDLYDLKSDDLVKMIRDSEGRTLMAETVVSCEPHTYGISNPELAASFGADMITLNIFDFDNPIILGLDQVEATDISNNGEVKANALALIEQIERNKKDKGYIKRLKEYSGRPIGVNLEPVPSRIEYPNGLRVNKENIKKAIELGFDYVVITGNPKTGIEAKDIVDGIKLVRSLTKDMMIIAGKMHGAGGSNVYDKETIGDFAKAGADVVMIGAPGTLPGMTLEVAKELVDEIHKHGALAKAAMGTSQEGADRTIVEKIAHMSKMAGADIIHIGDAGFNGIADPENIKYSSIAIRGKRHTYRRIGNRR